MNVPEAYKQYRDSYAAILEHFGCPQTWQEYMLDEQLDVHWFLARHGDTVVYSPKPITPEALKDFGEEGCPINDVHVMSHRHMDSSIYRKDDHVLILIDTQTDGNRFLTLYSADKEITGQEAKTLARMYDEY
jgi:hypothetical protein